MGNSKKCDHIAEIMCRTTFGQGDSSTEVWVQCRICEKKTTSLWQYGWPADKSLMRKSLTQFQEK